MPETAISARKLAKCWKWLAGAALLLLLVALPTGGWLLGVWMASREYGREMVPRDVLERMGYIAWAESLGASDLAEHMEGDVLVSVGLATFHVDSVADLSATQLDVLQHLKGYYDRQGISLEDVFRSGHGPMYTHLRKLLEDVPWAPDDLQRRDFAAKYRKGVPDPAPSLASVAWLANTDQPPDLHGKVVLVDFWGLRCGRCIAAMPDVQKLWETYGLQGLAVVALHCQERKDGRTHELVREMVKDKSWTFPVGQAPPPLGKEFWVYSLPAYYLIDRAGRLAHGPASELPDEDRIRALLNATSGGSVQGAGN